MSTHHLRKLAEDEIRKQQKGKVLAFSVQGTDPLAPIVSRDGRQATVTRYRVRAVVEGKKDPIDLTIIQAETPQCNVAHLDGPQALARIQRTLDAHLPGDTLTFETEPNFAELDDDQANQGQLALVCDEATGTSMWKLNRVSNTPVGADVRASKRSDGGTKPGRWHRI